MTGSGERVFASRTRCIAGSRAHTGVGYFGSLAPAALLATSLLILLAAPVDAAGGSGAGIDQGEAKRAGEHLTARVGDRLVSSYGLRGGPSRSREAGQLEGTADADRSRWRDWTWSSFVRIGDDGCAGIGSRATAGHEFRLAIAIPIAALDSTDPDGDRSRWKHAAPMRFAGARGASGDGFIDLFGADCD